MGVAVGRGVAVGVGLGVGTAVGVAVGTGVGVGVAVGNGVAVGVGLGLGVGSGVAVGVGVAVGEEHARRNSREQSQQRGGPGRVSPHVVLISWSCIDIACGLFPTTPARLLISPKPSEGKITRATTIGGRKTTACITTP